MVPMVAVRDGPVARPGSRVDRLQPPNGLAADGNAVEFSPNSASFLAGIVWKRPRLRRKTEWNRERAMSKTTDRAQSRRIRVLPEQWERIENAARGTGRTANELVVELALEALDRRAWPRTEAEIHLLRSAMFSAQAIIRDMEKAGRQEEIEAISRSISEIAPELTGDVAPDRE